MTKPNINIFHKVSLLYLSSAFDKKLELPNGTSFRKVTIGISAYFALCPSISYIKPVTPEYQYKEGLVFVEGLAVTTAGASYVTIRESVLENVKLRHRRTRLSLKIIIPMPAKPIVGKFVMGTKSTSFRMLLPMV